MLTPGPANVPAPPRAFGWLARQLRRWLGIADQRHDFDALAYTLSVKDGIVEGLGRDLFDQHRQLAHLTEQLHHVASLAGSLQDRLHWYETRVPQIGVAKQAYDLAVKREQKRRGQAIKDHPEWTNDEKQSMWRTGKLPEPPDDAPQSQPPASAPPSPT